jgi:chorismate mutase
MELSIRRLDLKYSPLKCNHDMHLNRGTQQCMQIMISIELEQVQ